MRKLITPIIYVAFLFPLTGISVGIELFLREIAILGEYKNVIDLPLIIVFSCSIIIVGIPLFWIANLLIQRFEKIREHNFLDHFRQSLFFYLIVISSSTNWILRGLGNSEADGYLLIWIGISVVGISVNYIFLFLGGKANISNKPSNHIP